MLDIHCHIIPSVDDGADSLETSFNMLKIAEKDSTKIIIATPHFWIGHYENSYLDVVEKVKSLNEKIIENKMNIKILPGQEIFLDNKTNKLYKEGIVNCLNGGKYMLIELPMMDMPKSALDNIYELRIKGITPILAHPERYKYIVEKPSNINQFIREGCLIQINTGSIKGIFGKKIKKTAEILIKHGICNFIASDAHTIGNRCPGLLSSLEKVKSINKEVYLNFKDNCNMLLENKIINTDFEEIKEKKSIFSLLFKKKWSE
ncbi:tyrosine-protein phosphatase [Clostridium cochlearium]|uniref:protein-tyrosine-phosphatase n=1 Tax=Clostridium cochlearium TaxID=1494 RepID=A0A7Y4DDC3_CLOCO|nr:CpsB/CapC family capsule biosynthesis tyrosine phosphatase [Clostridium cochlearium]NOH16244.1 exopolysaccharide biosynthesis protein [Clostridium cochlearium]